MTDASTTARPPLAERLRKNADGILEQIARDYGVSTFEVARALPAEHCTVVPGSGFEEVLRALTGRDEMRPLDPGTVRASLLEYRVVQDWGVSLAQTDALKIGLDADLVITGRVVHFSDGGAGSTPQVAFSLRVLDVAGRRAIWSCYGTNRGDDGVIAFDAGRYRSAHALARDMAEAAVATFLRDLERNSR